MAPLISPRVHYCGVFDPAIRTFDIIMKTANGSSYNAYVVKGSQGVALLDTVKASFCDRYFAQLEKICSYDAITHIVLHHLEPDHTGALAKLLQRAPGAKVLISFRAQMMLKALINQEIAFECVGTGDRIDLGGATLEFLSTPFLHWPDTMSSYLVEDRVLFSGDVFGAHFCDTRLFNDKVGDFDYAFKYYYDKIMRPFKQHVLAALELYKELSIDCIAPLHGPILRDQPHKYIARYAAYSSESRFPKYDLHHKVVTIFYISSYENTQAMAFEIFRGVDAVEGVRASIYDMSALDEAIMTDLLEESDGVLLGTPTINADAPKPAWDLLSMMTFLESGGKWGAAFGSYGWTGEAPQMLHDRMKGLKFRMPLAPLRIKLVPSTEELQQCYAYGVEFAERLCGKMVELEL